MSQNKLSETNDTLKTYFKSYNKKSRHIAPFQFGDKEPDQETLPMKISVNRRFCNFASKDVLYLNRRKGV